MSSAGTDSYPSDSYSRARGEIMPLKTGIWTINSRGTIGKLRIDGVDSNGAVRGNLVIGGGSLHLEGFWDEDLQKLTFSCYRNVTHRTTTEGSQLPDELQLWGLYVGLLFEDPVRITGVSGRKIFSLAGYFESFGSWLVTRHRRSGWYAQIGED
jgi:hypothetical protein